MNQWIIENVWSILAAFFSAGTIMIAIYEGIIKKRSHVPQFIIYSYDNQQWDRFDIAIINRKNSIMYFHKFESDTPFIYKGATFRFNQDIEKQSYWPALDEQVMMTNSHMRILPPSFMPERPDGASFTIFINKKHLANIPKIKITYSFEDSKNKLQCVFVSIA